jgi:hypothetical protein
LLISGSTAHVASAGAGRDKGSKSQKRLVLQTFPPHNKTSTYESSTYVHEAVYEAMIADKTKLYRDDDPTDLHLHDASALYNIKATRYGAEIKEKGDYTGVGTFVKVGPTRPSLVALEDVAKYKGIELFDFSFGQSRRFLNFKTPDQVYSEAIRYYNDNKMVEIGRLAITLINDLNNRKEAELGRQQSTLSSKGNLYSYAGKGQQTRMSDGSVGDRGYLLSTKLMVRKQ